MLSLFCIGSGSSGNCYLLSDGSGRTLILDAGIKTVEVKKALKFDLSKIDGVFISHEHTDHAKYISDFEKMGLEVFKPYANGKIRENKRIGAYEIQAFKLPHGEGESYGALIKHIPTKETILYMTDFEYCQYVFKAYRINHFLIECNYQDEYLDMDAANINHKVRGHCSLNTCKAFLKANITDAMQSVILIHLGLSTTVPEEIKLSITDVLPVEVFVDTAKGGVKYDLCPAIPFIERGE